MKYIHTLNEVPPAAHFVALIFSSIHIEGDERSRANPGHGYPAENKPVVEYIAFKDRAEMEAWVLKEETSLHGKTSYKIIEATPMTIVKSVSVKAIH